MKTLKDRILQKLFDRWGSDPQLIIGVPWRRMATEAANLAMEAIEEEDELDFDAIREELQGSPGLDT